MADDPYEHRWEGNDEFIRAKGSSDSWQKIGGAATGGGAKTDSTIKSQLGFQGSDDSTYGKMSDADIDKLPPLQAASARARRKRWQSAQAQVSALKPSPSPSPGGSD